jgi:hypothetical protein
MTATTDLETSLLANVQGDALAVMLYGSYARGDATAESDIDILQLSAVKGAHYNVGKLAVSRYTPDELTLMCRSGSLFALHLATEGRIILDNSGTLRAILASYTPPSDYSNLWQQLLAASQCLAVSEEEACTNIEGFVRLAIYLVRTAAILTHIEKKGFPTFSIRKLATELNLNTFHMLFEGRDDASQLDYRRLVLGRDLLADLLHRPIQNRHGSLEALATNEEVQHPVAARIAMNLLAGSRTVGYGDILLDLGLLGSL